MQWHWRIIGAYLALDDDDDGGKVDDDGDDNDGGGDTDCNDDDENLNCNIFILKKRISLSTENLCWWGKNAPIWGHFQDCSFLPQPRWGQYNNKSWTCTLSVGTKLEIQFGNTAEKYSWRMQLRNAEIAEKYSLKIHLRDTSSSWPDGTITNHGPAHYQ